jgi:hypothetical protein
MDRRPKCASLRLEDELLRLVCQDLALNPRAGDFGLIVQRF